MSLTLDDHEFLAAPLSVEIRSFVHDHIDALNSRLAALEAAMGIASPPLANAADVLAGQLRRALAATKESGAMHS